MLVVEVSEAAEAKALDRGGEILIGESGGGAMVEEGGLLDLAGKLLLERRP